MALVVFVASADAALHLAIAFPHRAEVSPDSTAVLAFDPPVCPLALVFAALLERCVCTQACERTKSAWNLVVCPLPLVLDMPLLCSQCTSLAVWEAWCEIDIRCDYDSGLCKCVVGRIVLLEVWVEAGW